MKPFPIEKIVASFDHQLSEQEEKQLQSWLEASAENIKLYKETKRVFETTRKTRLNFNPDTGKALIKVNGRLKTKQLYRWWYRAAAVLLLVVLAAKVLFLPPETQWHEITAENRQVVYLNDNSKVVLAENATFKYPDKFRDKQRSVLLSGKAYFEITKDAEHPFVVKTAHTSIKVVGTRFLVDASAKSSEKVFVDEGKVIFKALAAGNKQTISLTQNETGIWLAKNNSLTETTYSNLNRNAWLSGKLTFNNSTLEKVFLDFEKYFHIKIEYPESLKSRRYTGNFTEPITAGKALNVVCTTLNLQLSNSATTYTIKP